jgi:HPt (histidine-containing phosphotransfer) domain-containing protein
MLSTELFNPQTLEKFLGTDDLIKKNSVYRIYVDEVFNLRERLKNQEASGSIHDFATILHNLKSTSKSVGAIKLSRICEIIEAENIKNLQNETWVEENTKNIAELLKIADLTVKAINQHIDSLIQ